MTSPIDQIRRYHPELAAIRQDIHAHPELGLEEHRTADLVARKLEEWVPHGPIEQYRHNDTGEDNADSHIKRQLMGREVVVAVYPELKNRVKPAPADNVVAMRRAKPKKGPALPIRGLIPGMAMHFAGTPVSASCHSGVLAIPSSSPRR